MTQHIHNQDCFVEGTQVCGVTPAEQASKQVPTIDTPEFRELMAEHWKACGSVKANKAFAVVVAHIDAQLAGQPAAPVAATEQAIYQIRFEQSWAWLDADESTYNTFDPKRRRIVYATPADAGAELTDEQITEVVRRSVAAGEIIWAGFKKDSEGRYTIPDLSPMEFGLARLIEREVLARLSTSAAPVTAEPVARQLISDIVKLWDSPSIDEDEHHEELARIEGEMRKFLVAPVSPQPAAQVPSIDRDSVIEEAARRVEERAANIAPVELIGEACHETARNVIANVAAAVRALKSQPAAAHAAKSDEDGELLRLVVENRMDLHFEGQRDTEDDAVWVDELMKWSDGDRLCATRALIREVAAAHAAHDQKGGWK